MREPVCPGDSKANNPEAKDIAIRPEDMEQAIQLGIVPEEVIEAGKSYTMDDETHYMSTGMTAWRAIAFALERDLDLPIWVRKYLQHVANGIEDWAACSGHPSEIKGLLHLQGKRQHDRENADPRWIYEAIDQMKQQQPKKSIARLSQEYLKSNPDLDYSEEAIRQKYYEGKKLTETGQDYKGRRRIKDLRAAPYIVAKYDDDGIEF